MLAHKCMYYCNDPGILMRERYIVKSVMQEIILTGDRTVLYVLIFVVFYAVFKG